MGNQANPGKQSTTDTRSKPIACVTDNKNNNRSLGWLALWAIDLQEGVFSFGNRFPISNSKVFVNCCTRSLITISEMRSFKLQFNYSRKPILL